METTLCILKKDNKILLAKKKKGFGEGKYNGIGGKLEENETAESAMLRETKEEIFVSPIKYEKVGLLKFSEYYKGKKASITMHIYLVEEWLGEPLESAEMAPQWFNLTEIPYHEMLPDDYYWLPLILEGKKIEGYFEFDENWHIINKELHLISNFTELKKAISKCRYCKNKFGFEPHPIFWGEENSKIAQISQAPSNRVNESGKPFTDMSGETLIKKWYKIEAEEFYNSKNFFIGAIAHCYPGKDKNGNDKIPPKCCFDKWVKEELKLINNQIYIIIGAKAAKIFFPNEKFDDLVFKNKEWNNKLTIVLPHPSPLNKKWLKDHPEFMNKRIIEIRKIISSIIKS